MTTEMRPENTELNIKRDSDESPSPELANKQASASDAELRVTRARSSLRQRYEAEARVIERRVGGLEAIRKSLGLSQRKMAQLLLVDPSAWTRWNQGENAPPHVWRALAWYLALQEKYPALDSNFWLQGVARTSDADRISQNADEIRAQKLRTLSLESKIKELEREIDRLMGRSKHLDGAPLASKDGQNLIAQAQDSEQQQIDASVRSQNDQSQAETRALANAFIAITFGLLGYALAVWLSK
jgi:transcriptional regulator with XRE-family HTH domain